MSRLSDVVERAVALVTPAPEEAAKVGSIALSVLEKTVQAAGEHPHTRGAILGGSFAKGTWLPGYVDVDIFVRFDPATPEDVFEKTGLDVGRAATRGYPAGKKYAQHPYTEAIVDDVRVNIVPCYKVDKGRWKSAADRSPYHVDLVKKLPEETKKHIRLLKRFMIGVGVYGAEIKTRGFSGYAAEVLTMKNGDLEGVLRSFADFRVADEERLFTLPDPVDGNRDLAVAISGEKLGMLVLASRGFLRSPRLAYLNKVSGASHTSLRRSVVAVVFSHRELSEDTLWGELRKTSRHIVRHLEVHGFRVSRWMAASDNKDHSAFLLIPEFTELPVLEQRVGPTVDRRKDVQAFISSNRNDSRLVWVDDEARIRLLRPREYLRIQDLLEDIAKGKAGPTGASRELATGMRKTASVLYGGSLARAANSKGWLDQGVKEIVTDAIGTRSN